ncbi:MAG: hypothetical protein ACK5MZ_06340 [Aestuariibaculum sp.]
MKPFILFLILSLNKGCSQETINFDTITIEYSAVSRRVQQNIKINNKTISVKNGQNKDVLKTNKTNWNSLVATLQEIDIKAISYLKAPSEKRFFDGAAIANLTITYQDSVYKTSSFDHGNPPQEIAGLVKEILSISKNIE